MERAPVVLVTLATQHDTEWLSDLARGLGWEHSACVTTEDALARLSELEESNPRPMAVVAAALGTSARDSCWPLLRVASAKCDTSLSRDNNGDTRHLGPVSKSAFSVILSRSACADPRIRMDCFANGARMVTDDRDAVEEAFRKLDSCRPSEMTEPLVYDTPRYACPECGMGGFTENQLHAHGPMYHGAEWNHHVRCPVCDEAQGWPVHFHNHHGPPQSREPPPAFFSAFSLVVCRGADGRFLMPNERADKCPKREVPGYWLPAGRLDRGEGFLDAARRETMEEGGVEVEVTGVLRFTLDRFEVPCPRLVLLAEPVAVAHQKPQRLIQDDEASMNNYDNDGIIVNGTTDDAAAMTMNVPSPKTVPDWESVGAIWVAPDQLESLSREDYRARDPAKYFPAVAGGRLVPHSVETESFRQLEEVMARLTGDKNLTREHRAGMMLRAWEALTAEYPFALFRED